MRSTEEKIPKVLSDADVSKANWRRLRALYDLPADTQLKNLGGGQNVSLLMLTPEGKKRVLRIYKGRDRAIPAIQAELEVLVYVEKNTNLAVPFPIRNIEGEALTLISDGNDKDQLQAAMFPFLDGTSIREKPPSDQIMFEIGRTLGKLDMALAAADREIFPSPSDCRGKWDGESLTHWALRQCMDHQEEFLFLRSSSISGGLNQDIKKVANCLCRNFRKLKSRLPHQLIHADVHFGNLMLIKEKIGILDFDNLGEGPRIYELMGPYYSLYNWANQKENQQNKSWLPQMTKAVLSGYETEIQLTEVEAQAIPLFQALKLFIGLGWSISRKIVSENNDLINDTGSARIKDALKLLVQYEEKCSGAHNFKIWNSGLENLKKTFSYFKK